MVQMQVSDNQHVDVPDVQPLQIGRAAAPQGTWNRLHPGQARVNQKPEGPGAGQRFHQNGIAICYIDKVKF